MSSRPAIPTADTSGSRWRRLALVGLALVVVWGILLPAVSRQPAVSTWIRDLEEQGINPSAMYYTELESFQPVLERLNRELRRKHEVARSATDTTD